MTSRRPSGGAVGFLVMSLLAGPVLAPDSDAQRAHAKRLELFRFVLHRDAAWQLVLDQRIKLTDNDRTLYDRDVSMDADMRARLRLVDDDAAMISPLPVIQSVLLDFEWLGSHVAYAAHILRRAFSCVVHVHVSRVIEILEALEKKTEEVLRKQAAEEAASKKDEEASVKSDQEAIEEQDDQFLLDVEPFSLSFREAWSAIAMLADKLAVIGDRLNVMADLSNVLSNALVTKKVIPFPVVRLMRYEIDRMIDVQCERHQPVQVYLELGFTAVQGNPFGKKSTPAGLKMSIGQVTKRLFAYYDSLQIENIPTESWAQVFNYQIANMKGVILPSMINDMLEQHPWKEMIEQKRREYEIILMEKYAREKLEGEKSVA